MRNSAALLAVLIAWVGTVRAQTPVDACDPPIAIQALSPERHNGVKLSTPDREAKIAAIRASLAHSPDDLFLNRWWIELQPKPQTGSLAAEYREKLAKHPEDPRFICLCARTLVGKDTPAAIQSFEKLIAREPKLPWAYLALTEVYSSAAFRDPAKLAENLRAFHDAYPANLEAFANLNVIEDPRALREFAGALRAQLENATEPSSPKAAM
jgi:hypothetical protein